MDARGAFFPGRKAIVGTPAIVDAGWIDVTRHSKIGAPSKATCCWSTGLGGACLMKEWGNIMGENYAGEW